MPELWLERLAAEFWQAAGGAEPFPRALESSIIWALPVAIVKLPRLSVSSARKWLVQRNMPLDMNERDRHLHACVIAFGGKGVILLDGRDPVDEMRFSLAHETAHFMIDYLNPRRIALQRFGIRILEVLDGRRPPTTDERGEAVLSNTSIGVYRHLMRRSVAGQMETSRVVRAERKADELALELLAPDDVVRTLMKGSAESSNTSRLDIVNSLKKYFGLPNFAAIRYSSRFGSVAKPQSVKEWLGIA